MGWNSLITAHGNKAILIVERDKSERVTTIVQSARHKMYRAESIASGADPIDVWDYLADALTAMFEETVRHDREQLTESARRDLARQRAEKRELDRAAWAARHGQRL